MHNRLPPKEFQTEMEVGDASIVLLHAPETIDPDDLGIDTIELIRKTINEWIEEK